MNERLSDITWKFRLGIIISLLLGIPIINFINGLIGNYISNNLMGYLGIFIEIIIIFILIEFLFRSFIIEQVSQLTGSVDDFDTDSKDRNIIRNIKDEIDDLSIYSQELSASSKEGNVAVKKTNDLVEKILASIEEISASAEEVTGFAEEATAQTQQGRDNIDDTISSINEINQVVDETVDTMQQLDDNAQEIGEIIELITNIADQTNLLALNAAIEAARAGEQGQGFAVVAEEIRELAEETSSATNNIIDIVETTQDKAGEGLDSIKQVKNKAEQSKVVAEETNQIFFQIEGASQEVAEMIEQTAAAASDLAESSDELMDESETLASIFDVVSDSSDELADMSTEVSRLLNDSEVNSDGVELIKWDDSYSIGIEKVDQQHKQLFEQVNKLIIANRENRGKEEIGEIIEFLADYTVQHFSDEEEIQQESDYPDYERHKKIHDNFVQDAVEFKEQFEEGRVDTGDMMKFNRKIAKWLVNHVKGIDQEIAEYVRE